MCFHCPHADEEYYPDVMHIQRDMHVDNVMAAQENDDALKEERKSKREGA